MLKFIRSTIHFTFERLSRTGLSLMPRWLLQPHVAQWFGDPNERLEEMVTNLEAEWVWHFRADLAGNPTGFAQCYDTAKAPQRTWSTQQPGTLGVDYFLGRTAVLGQGSGSRLLMEFVAYMTAQWHSRRIIADPDRHNVLSVRAVQTCSFIMDEETGLFVKEVREAASPDVF